MVLPMSMMYRELGFGGCGLRGSGRELHTVLEREAEDNLLRSTSLKFDSVELGVGGEESPRALASHRAVNLVVMSPDGRRLASAHADNSIHLIDALTARVTDTLKERHTNPVWALTFHPTNSDLLATGCLAGKVCVWDLKNKGSEALVCQDNAAVASLSFHPLTRCLAIAVGDRILFWDWEDTEPFLVSTTRQVHERVRYVGFSERGRYLHTAVTNHSLLGRPLDMDIGLNAARTTLHNPLSMGRIYSRREMLESYRQALAMDDSPPLTRRSMPRLESPPSLSRAPERDEDVGPSVPKRTRADTAERSDGAGPSHSRPTHTPVPPIRADAVPTAAFDANMDISAVLPAAPDVSDPSGESLSLLTSAGQTAQRARDRSEPRAPTSLNTAIDEERRRRSMEVEEVARLVAEATARRDRLTQRLRHLQRMSQRDGEQRNSLLGRLEITQRPDIQRPNQAEETAERLQQTLAGVRARRRHHLDMLHVYRRENANARYRGRLPPRPPESGEPWHRTRDSPGSYERVRASLAAEPEGPGPTPCCRIRPTTRLQRWLWDPQSLPLKDVDRGMIAPNVRLRNDNSLAFSNDGQLVACMTGVEASDMKLQVISLRDLDLGRVLYEFSFGPDVLACLAFSPTDNHILVGLSDGRECMLGLHNLFRPFARVFRLVDKDRVLLPPHHAKKLCSRREELLPGQLKAVLNLKRSGVGGLGRSGSADVSAMVWLRQPGLGFLYASRRGSLTIITPKLSEDAGGEPEGGVDALFPDPNVGSARSISGPAEGGPEEESRIRLAAIVRNLRHQMPGNVENPDSSDSESSEEIGVLI